MANLNVWISACAVLLLCGAEYGMPCPSGWMRLYGRCFKVITSSTTFSKAEVECRNLKAHLASVHSKIENSFIRSLVLKSSASSLGAWIGGSDEGSEGKWKWVDGTPFNFPGIWASKQPDNYGGSENCLMLTPDGNLDWNDLRCDDNRPFICSMNSILMREVTYD